MEVIIRVLFILLLYFISEVLIRKLRQERDIHAKSKVKGKENLEISTEWERERC